MAKPYRKAKARLDKRIQDYDKLSPADQTSRKRPGSMKKKAKGRA